jgi:hypothetical protein
MKTCPRYFYGVITGVFLALNLSSASVTDTNPLPRLNVELRDGSRIVGQSMEQSFKFHSFLLGDLNLNVKEIRSVDCVSTNSANLTTINGDILTGWFVDAELPVNTRFGKVGLPVNSIRRAFISIATANASIASAGLIGLWSGEGNGIDSVGENNATLTDISIVGCRLGQAFSFNGASSSIRIPASQSLNVGVGDGLSIEGWIYPSSIAIEHPIVEWDDASKNLVGVHFWISSPMNNGNGSGCLYANIKDTAGYEHRISSAGALVFANTLQHVALTYDKTSGVARIYLNGFLVKQQNLGKFTPQTSYDLYLGHRATGYAVCYYWVGVLDEIAIYNRVLSDSEIRAMCIQRKLVH